jgi:hypothetical protein
MFEGERRTGRWRFAARPRCRPRSGAAGPWKTLLALAIFLVAAFKMNHDNLTLQFS